MAVLNRLKGQEIFEKSKEVISGGVNSPVRAFGGLGVGPLVAQSGRGDTITDVDGRCFIDYCMSWGALLHGHAHPEIVRKACERVRAGSSFGSATEIEEKLARKICTATSAEQLRFVSSGTEATMSAVRLARGYTSRPLIIKFEGNYHGHSDALLAESSPEGIPDAVLKSTLTLPYNDLLKFTEVMRDPVTSQQIAAVIVEPIAANMGVVPASPAFLERVREETERVGALLIFDEVISGFRVGYGGAEEIVGITPDLICFGKIIGGGFPAAAFGGRREIMQKLAPIGGVYQAGTLSGNPVAMQAGLTALELAEQPGFYERLRKKSEIITEPVKRALLEKDLSACLQEVGGMFTLFWGPKSVSSSEDLLELDKERFKVYFRFMFERGVYLSPSPYEACFISSVHTEENLERTRELILEFIEQC
ncbi:MAG: Glutamate-1-semialdehyde 2,1-aminomutase [Chlamydiae bacterium]|nr:Glutamate-1-semialdehyde 2,1-aminomutase [Chlamydiota bacterium]